MILIAGPCVIEEEYMAVEIAKKLKRICADLGINFFFKASFDKANRSSFYSYRGPGLEKGLQTLWDIKKNLKIKVTTDVHETYQVGAVATYVDLIQIPAFLCRQTDLIVKASESGLPVNIKKGQFVSPMEVKNIIEKFISTMNRQLMITERGTTFGYNNLVVDMRAFPIMNKWGYPIIYDVTHSLQLPGGNGTSTGGQVEFALPLAKAAIAAGARGLFIETHPEPNKALCDATTQFPLSEMPHFLREIKTVWKVVNA